jgi:acyl carrier protein
VNSCPPASPEHEQKERGGSLLQPPLWPIAHGDSIHLRVILPRIDQRHITKRGKGVSTVTRDERLVTIKEIVCDILEIEEDEVTEVSLFKEDHNADSLRAIEILAALEKEFGVVINQSELPRMVNLKGVYEVVSEPAGW